MGLSHTEPAYTDRAAPIIEKFGGKFGGLEFLRAHVPKLRPHLLPTAFIMPGENYRGQLPPDVGKSDVIVRASHPNDFQGLVDVLQTEIVQLNNENDINEHTLEYDENKFDQDPPYKHPSDAEKIAGTIENIRNAAQNSKTMSYGQYENSTYNGRIIVGIQRLLVGRGTGSIVEHQNRPGVYWINYDMRGRLSTGNLEACLYDEKTKKYIQLNPLSDLEIVPLETLIQTYKTVRKSGLVQDNISFQMEFGLDRELSSSDPSTLKIHQIRAFMRKQIANFKLENTAEENDGIPNLILGITPPEGTVLRLLFLDDIFFNKKFSEPKMPCAATKYDHKQKLPLTCMPSSLMQAYIAAHRFNNSFNPRNLIRRVTPSLSHNHFRLAQKSEVTVINSSSLPILADLDYDPEQNIRLIADGIHARIEML